MNQQVWEHKSTKACPKQGNGAGINRIKQSNQSRGHTVQLRGFAGVSICRSHTKKKKTSRRKASTPSCKILRHYFTLNHSQDGYMLTLHWTVHAYAGSFLTCLELWMARQQAEGNHVVIARCLYPQAFKVMAWAVTTLEQVPSCSCNVSVVVTQQANKQTNKQTLESTEGQKQRKRRGRK